MIADYLEIFSPATFNRFKNADGSLKIAIVGNAGGLTERDKEVIASSDCVIRFNNYATREGIDRSNDQCRCDILFTTGDLHSEGAKPTFVVLAIPLPFHMDSGVCERMHQWYPFAKLYMPNPWINFQACKDLNLPSLGHEHPLPTAGFTAIYHILNLINIYQNFKPEVFVAGFSFYYNNGMIQNTWPIERTDYPKHWNHHYPAEVRWMIKNILQHKNFSFGSRMIEILIEMAGRI